MIKSIPKVFALTIVLISSLAYADEPKLLEPLEPFVAQVVSAQQDLPNARRELLSSAAADIVELVRANESANLVFICTHNSRRSHLSQIWCQVAANYFGVSEVQTFSGGLEATACNIRTVRALQRAGLSVVTSTLGSNPVYLIQYAEDVPPIRVYSKTYSDEANPKDNLIAMMCCSDADEKCPLVPGASVKVALHYDDPKAADGTPQEASKYDERNFQIAVEMFFLMSQVKNILRG